MPIVEKLKMIKNEKGLSNAEIAKISEIPLATITRVFNGQTPNPTFETISRIAIATGTSIDELTGFKQPEASPIPSPIETTINSYVELLKEKDDRIKELKEEKEKERKEKNKLVAVLIGVLAFLLVLLTMDLFNSGFGYFRT